MLLESLSLLTWIVLSLVTGMQKIAAPKKKPATTLKKPDSSDSSSDSDTDEDDKVAFCCINYAIFR